MIKLLIPTRPDDSHAIYIKLALEEHGHKVDLWYTRDYPTQLTYSFQLSKNKLNWHAQGVDCDIYNGDYDVVWYRRPGNPVLPNFIHKDDIKNAKYENNMFVRNIWQVILPNATWINPVNAALKANSKLLQLKLATELGLKIPETVISNDPRIIKKYVKENLGSIIYKTFYPMTWINKDELRLTYTSDIQLSDLPSNRLLQCVPGIFQEKITKNYELRITYFGDQYIAVKIDSQKNVKTKLDWRAASAFDLLLEQVILPKEIDQKCRELMAQLGIVFGCFDFIVSTEDEYYFLEVNEQGQFLWIEDVNPAIKMLQAFCKFVTKSDYNLDMRNYRKQAEHVKENAMRFHINTPVH